MSRLRRNRLHEVQSSGATLITPIISSSVTRMRPRGRGRGAAKGSPQAPAAAARRTPRTSKAEIAWVRPFSAIAPSAPKSNSAPTAW